ncbi:MAG TPA: DUF1523 family protein [Moraxellaceae bacterium]
MKKVRAVLWTLLVLVLVAFGLLLAYSLPHHEVVHVNGHEVKRIDLSGKFVDPQKALEGTRDVFFIYTADAETNEVRVFRNEDTRFNFPWYLKFDSSEVQGRAQLLARDNSQYALATYYGWRIPMFGMFPNAVNLEAWPDTQEPFPVFNTIFFVVLGLLVLVIAWKWRKWRRSKAVTA